MRALPLMYPSDPRVREISDQFMFGPSLLISPVVNKGASEQDVWLPGAGTWIDFWTGQRQNGGGSIKADAPLSQIPIHIRGGSILVLGPIVQSAEDVADPLEIRIYPGSDADFSLFEDHGDTYSYESGQRATIPMHWDDRHHLLVVGPTKGSFPNMLKRHTLRIVRVREGHGVGVLPEGNVDLVVQYEGKRIAIEVSDSSRGPFSATLAH